MNEYKGYLRILTDELGEEIARFGVRAKDFASLRTKVKKGYHIFDDEEYLEEFRLEKLRQSFTSPALQTNDLFQQITGEDFILVRNDDGTAMVLVKENGKWRLAE